MSFALMLARLFGCVCRGLSRRITFAPSRQALLHQFPNRLLIPWVSTVMAADISDATPNDDRTAGRL